MKYSNNYIIGYFIVFFITLTLPMHAIEKVLVITHSFNRPNLIEFQYRTLKKFLTDDYEFVIFNDAPNENISQEIQAICKKYKLKCIRIPQKIHHGRNTACERCADVIQYSLNTVCFNFQGIVAIIDSDMFLIRKFNINQYLKGYDIAGCKQCRGPDNAVTYLWNGLVFMNMRTLPQKRTINFNCGYVLGYPTDVGGNLHYYIQSNPSLKIRYFNSHIIFNNLPENPRTTLHMLNFSIDQRVIDFIFQYPYIDNYENDMELHGDGNFLHYRAGSNWQRYPQVYHAKKEQLITSFINQLLK